MRVEHSALGRIVVPETLPRGKALFYTTVDFPGQIDERIAAVIKDRFGIDGTLASCHQVHGAGVKRVTGLPGYWVGEPVRNNQAARQPGNPTCDALWTTESHVALGIKVADCLPVTLIDGDVIANIHSGWRSAVQRITAVTLDTLERDTKFDPRSASAYLGPAIRVCCFEVGEDVAAQFPSAVVDRTRVKPHVDVAGLTVDLLRRRGFDDGRIFDSGLCTRCDNSIFHSFRRDGKRTGRNLAIVAQ